MATPFNPVVASLLVEATETAEASEKLSREIYPRLKRLDATVSQNCARLTFDALEPDERIHLAEVVLASCKERKSLVEQMRPFIDLMKEN